MIIQEKIHGLRLADDNEIQVNIFLKFDCFFRLVRTIYNMNTIYKPYIYEYKYRKKVYD